jgi:hypothetical protein
MQNNTTPNPDQFKRKKTKRTDENRNEQTSE